MLSVVGVSKRAGGRVLFSELSFQVNRGARVGLVGANGSGKTTLFLLILGREEPDAGSIQWQRGVSVGYLPQETVAVGEETVVELASAITPELAEVRARMRAEEAGEPAREPRAGWRDQYDALGGPQLEARARRLLAGLAFRESDFARPARQLSGGWLMRAHLARLLVQEPDLLLLDEPTNHLDLATLGWFQEYLLGYPGAILTISHDREFLNRLVGSILELRQGQLRRFHGNYDEYVAQKEAFEEQQLAAYKNQQREIARLMRFVERFRAKNTKATQAQSKLKQIERMDQLEAPAPEEPEIEFSFPQPPRSGLKVITLTGIHHAYGDQVVYRGMDFVAERGQRLVLVGPNGAGKSTLLKLLAGVVPAQTGRRELGHNVRVGYYAQYRADTLEPERTVLEEALNTPQRVTEEFVRTVLGAFLFRGDDVFKRVRVLSGGEKSRLALVKFLLDPPNLLLMDEPTTHLDLASTDALAAALSEYQGTLIFISHDVYFIRALARQVLQIEAGKLTWHAGDYQYYLDRMAAAAALAASRPGADAPALPAPPAPKAAPSALAREQRRREAEARLARSRARKQQEERVRALEAEIAALEARQADLLRQIENPQTYAAPGEGARANLALAEVLQQLERLHTDWETAATQLAQIEAAKPA